MQQHCTLGLENKEVPYLPSYILKLDEKLWTFVAPNGKWHLISRMLAILGFKDQVASLLSSVLTAVCDLKGSEATMHSMQPSSAVNLSLNARAPED